MKGEKPRRMKVHIPEEELQFTYARSSGAGGQNVNKVNSKAVLRWAAANSRILVGSMRERFLARYGSRLTVDGDLVVMSDRHRDQGKNASDCMDKLREIVESIAIAPKKRRATKPTFGSKMRRLDSKRLLSDKKQGRRTRDDD
jgi:ribosome-associated protein